MLRFLLEHTPVKRLARGVPVVALLSAAEIAKLIGRHVSKLQPDERRRLLALVAKARRGTGSLSRSERRELSALVAKLDPRENEVIHLTSAERAAFVAAVQPVRAKFLRELDPKLLAPLEH